MISIVLVFSLLFPLGFVFYSSVENSAPVVKIEKPLNKDYFSGDSPIYYSVKVEDKEDGNSDFQEIISKEVFLKAWFYSGTLSQYEKKRHDFYDPEEIALSRMAGAGCFNCHAFEEKVIGPSWRSVSGRYKEGEKVMGSLIQKVREGATGVWGEEKMPAHPDLKKEEVMEIVKWILHYGEQQNFRYYVGLKGVIPASEVKTKGVEGMLVLSASYTDHGVNGEFRKRGSDSIVLINTRK